MTAEKVIHRKLFEQKPVFLFINATFDSTKLLVGTV